MNWLHAEGSDVVLSLHVQPGAKTNEICGLHGEALKIRLAAPPIDGRANACLIEFLADRLGAAKNRVELVGGAGARAKRVRVHDISAAVVAQRLMPG